MIGPVLEIVKSAASFLRDGPNASETAKQLAEDENHFASKKFFVIFSAIFMLAFVFYTSVGILWVLPRTPEIVTAFVTIFAKVMEIFGLIISVYIGAQGLVDLRYNSSSNAGLQGEVDVREEILSNNTKEDDYTISENNL
jgi:hypothetical protein